ncbi:MAG: cupin domain-containing protein [Bdellovibrionales bacterium]|nr:cupin domain-containing protein [Bdellovibrionales bacterium]
MAKHRIVRWSKQTLPTDSEVEALLHAEGYESFTWYDVPGATYRRHKHDYDECIWVIQGSMQFEIEGETCLLNPGDRLYLPKSLHHTAEVPGRGVSYLVGQKRT